MKSTYYMVIALMALCVGTQAAQGPTREKELQLIDIRLSELRDSLLNPNLSLEAQELAEERITKLERRRIQIEREMEAAQSLLNLGSSDSEDENEDYQVGEYFR